LDAILARGSEQFTKKKRQGKRRCHSILSFLQSNKAVSSFFLFLLFSKILFHETRR
jgi:hypothetical protein